MDENLFPFTIFSFFSLASHSQLCVSLSLSATHYVYVRESEKGGRGERKGKRKEIGTRGRVCVREKEKGRKKKGKKKGRGCCPREGERNGKKRKRKENEKREERE